MDFNTLAVVNARLSRTREAFHEALIVERETLAICSRLPVESPDRKLIQIAHEQVLETAHEYDEAVDEFAAFRVKLAH